MTDPMAPDHQPTRIAPQTGFPYGYDGSQGLLAPGDRGAGVSPAQRIAFRRGPGGIVGRRPALPIWLAGFMIAAAGVGSAAQPNTVGAVTPGGAGVLTKHLDWLVTSSRRTYHHISLPSRIAVGDTITLSFGSSPKTYGFTVARIILKGNHCESTSAETKFVTAGTRSTSPPAIRQTREDPQRKNTNIVRQGFLAPQRQLQANQHPISSMTTRGRVTAFRLYFCLKGDE